MSTNATIAIQRKDGTRTAIYLHYDGYIEGAGTTLQLAFNTADKVNDTKCIISPRSLDKGFRQVYI